MEKGIEIEEELKRLTHDEDDYKYILNYLSTKINSEDKQFRTINSVIKYKIKTAIMHDDTKISLEVDSSNNIIYVQIVALNRSKSFNIPKDWDNVDIWIPRNGCVQVGLNSEPFVRKYNKTDQPLVTINSLDVLYCRHNRADMLWGLLNGRIKVINEVSILRYIRNTVEKVISAREFNFHIVTSKYLYLIEDLALCVEVLHSLKLFKYFEQKFIEIGYLIHTTYEICSQQRNTEDKLEKNILKIKRIYSLLVDTIDKEIDARKKNK